jgi:hypothetical protein
MIGVVLSSWERERVLSGTHVASGRHVSTWAHAVYSWEIQLVGGSSCHSHDPYDSLEVCHPSGFTGDSRIEPVLHHHRLCI